MADLSNNSFIPKRGPAKVKAKEISRQVYIFTYISYILMFATLLATGGVFLYGQYVDQQLNDEIASLNAEISSFSEADMARVTDFDERLQQASGRLDTSVSIAALMEAIEAATIDTVQLLNLSVSREFDSHYTLNGTVQTDSFDSTIFQREVFEQDSSIEAVRISSVQTSTETGGSPDGTSLQARPVVNFVAELEVPITAIPYQAGRGSVAPAPLTITPPVVEESEVTTDAEVETESEAVTESNQELP